MNTCPNCGKMAGFHGSVLQGCMCQYSMQAPPQRPWVGLTDEEVASIYMNHTDRPMYEQWKFARAIEAKLKEKNT